MKKTCAQCQGKLNRQRNKFCSRSCYFSWRRENGWEDVISWRMENRGEDIKCTTCGKVYHRYPIRYKKPNNYCSKECRGKWLKENFKAPWLTKMLQQPGYNARISRQTTAMRADMLRGRGEGKTYRKRGGKHEHRFVMEKVLGRPLRSNEIVHHIDKNIHNNDPSNLLLTTRQEHMKFHREEARQGALNRKKKVRT